MWWVSLPPFSPTPCPAHFPLSFVFTHPSPFPPTFGGFPFRGLLGPAGPPCRWTGSLVARVSRVGRVTRTGPPDHPGGQPETPKPPPQLRTSQQAQAPGCPVRPGRASTTSHQAGPERPRPADSETGEPRVEGMCAGWSGLCSGYFLRPIGGRITYSVYLWFVLGLKHLRKSGWSRGSGHLFRPISFVRAVFPLVFS